MINAHKQFVREIKPRKFLGKVAWVPNKPLKRTIFTFDAAEMRLIDAAMLFDGNFAVEPKEAEITQEIQEIPESPTLKDILEKKKDKKADKEEDWDFAGRKIDIKERAWKLYGEKDSGLAITDPEDQNASKMGDTNPDIGLLDSPKDPDPEVSQDWDLLGQEQAQSLVPESEDSIDFTENKPYNSELIPIKDDDSWWDYYSYGANSVSSDSELGPGVSDHSIYKNLTPADRMLDIAEKFYWADDSDPTIIEIDRPEIPEQSFRDSIYKKVKPNRKIKMCVSSVFYATFYSEDATGQVAEKLSLDKLGQNLVAKIGQKFDTKSALKKKHDDSKKKFKKGFGETVRIYKKIKHRSFDLGLLLETGGKGKAWRRKVRALETEIFGWNEKLFYIVKKLKPERKEIRADEYWKDRFLESQDLSLSKFLGIREKRRVSLQK